MFSVAMYCSRMMARSIRVGLVIDCTALDLEEFEPLPSAKATSSSTKFDRRVRYFHNASEWDDYDVEYHRLLPPKRAAGDNNNDNYEPLAPQLLTEFYQTVSKFLQKSRSSASNDNNTMTHVALFDSRGGLGAAAYLAASYMCHNLKAPVHVAIEALKEGTPAQSGNDSDRKWGLCDVRLVKDLQSRFKGRKEIVMEGGNPSWWWAVDEDEDDNDDDDEQDDQEEDGGNGSIRKRKREEAIIIPPSDSPMEDDRSKRARNIDDGVASLYPNLPKEILEPVPKDSPKWNRAMSVLAQMTTPPSATPPSDPTTMSTLPLKSQVDISAGNTEAVLLQFIKNNPEKYKVTWLSTKGRRGLLLILSEAVYFMEQSTTSSHIISVSIITNMKFPTPKDLTKTQHRTLLDVVLVKDTERNKSTFRFYALDILCIEGGMVWHKPWEQRWRFLNEGVLMPRKKDESQQQQQQTSPVPSHAYAKEAIKIRAKEYFPMKKMGFVMKDVCAGVGHEAEGVRVVPMVEYGIGGNIGSEGNGGSMAVVWRRGCHVDDDELKSLLLST